MVGARCSRWKLLSPRAAEQACSSQNGAATQPGRASLCPSRYSRVRNHPKSRRLHLRAISSVVSSPHPLHAPCFLSFLPNWARLSLFCVGGGEWSLRHTGRDAGKSMPSRGARSMGDIQGTCIGRTRDVVPALVLLSTSRSAKDRREELSLAISTAQQLALEGTTPPASGPGPPGSEGTSPRRRGRRRRAAPGSAKSLLRATLEGTLPQQVGATALDIRLSHSARP